jgi:type IV secretory pathway VirB2 component (pilin)
MQLQSLRKLKANRSLIRAVIAAAFILTFALPAMAQAGGASPWDNALNNISGFFTGTFARVASLIAVIFGGWQLMHGEPGSKRAVAGVVAGVGAALLAANVIKWLFGV